MSELTTPTLHVRHERGTFAYRSFGGEDKPPLVMVQRLRGTMDDWDPALIGALARDRRVIVFDNLGVSRTDGESAADVRGMAESALAFIDALGERRVDLLGWSLGGAVAQRLTLDHPERVRRLVLAATGPGGVPDAPPMPPRVLDVVRKRENDAEDFLYLFFPETTEGRAAGLEHLARLRGWGDVPAPPVKPETVRAQLAAIVAWGAGVDSAYRELGTLKVPSFVANGVSDVMTHPYLAYATAQRAPHAELHLYRDSGHGFLFQHATRFARDVLEFLR